MGFNIGNHHVIENGSRGAFFGAGAKYDIWWYTVSGYAALRLHYCHQS